MKIHSTIVDSHVHFWVPGTLPYPWLESIPSLNRPLLPLDLSAAIGHSPVERYVFVECAAPERPVAEAAWVSNLAVNEPRICGIVAQAPLETGIAVRGHLEALAQLPLVKGIRRNLQAEPDPDFCLRPAFIDGVRALATHGFTFDICVRHDQLRSVVELVRRMREVRFVLDHCGKPAIREGQFEPWATNIRKLSAYENVWCKLSGLTTEADLQRWTPAQIQPYGAHVIECFGFDRVMFASDWPVVNLAGDYSQWLAAVESWLGGVPETDRAKIFRITAERFYRLSR